MKRGVVCILVLIFIFLFLNGVYAQNLLEGQCVVRESWMPRGNITITCPAGYIVTGGGFHDASSDKNERADAEQIDSRPLEDSSGWYCEDGNSNSNSKCYAVCCPENLISTEIIKETKVNFNPDDTSWSYVDCPSGTIVTGGGFGDFLNLDDTDGSIPYSYMQGWHAHEDRPTIGSDVYAVCGKVYSNYQLQCINKTVMGNLENGVQADCPVGYSITGGGWSDKAANDYDTDDSRPSGNGWYCEDDKTSSDDSECYAVCCKVEEILEQHDCDNSQVILRLSKETNALGEVFQASSSYPWEVCYNEIFGVDGTGNRVCSGTNKVLGLNAETDALAQIPSLTDYAAKVCYDELNCTKTNGLCSSLGSGYKHSVSLSADTGANLEDRNYVMNLDFFWTVIGTGTLHVRTLDPETDCVGETVTRTDSDLETITSAEQEKNVGGFMATPGLVPSEICNGLGSLEDVSYTLRISNPKVMAWFSDTGTTYTTNKNTDIIACLDANENDVCDYEESYSPNYGVKICCKIPPIPVEICDNGIDDDGDLLVDCLDTADCCSDAACSSDPACLVCMLDDAYWSSSTASEEELVTLTVDASGCDSQNIRFEVWENDTSEGNNDDRANVGPDPVSVTINGGRAETTWTAEKQCDGYFPLLGCTWDPPEYYFNATVVGGADPPNVIWSDSLTVYDCACSDGTPCGSCVDGSLSENDFPLYCNDNGVLIEESCGNCGCPIEKPSCEEVTGTCFLPPGTVTLCEHYENENDCKNFEQQIAYDTVETDEGDGYCSLTDEGPVDDFLENNPNCEIDNIECSCKWIDDVVGCVGDEAYDRFCDGELTGRCFTSGGNLTNDCDEDPLGWRTIQIVKEWTGSDASRPADCQTYKDKKQCIRTVMLGFFDTINLIVAVLIIIIFYVVVFRKKKKYSGKKEHNIVKVQKKKTRKKKK